MSQDDNEKIDTINSLELDWVFGMNKDIYGGVHHLGDAKKKVIFYVAGHIGVIYDFANHKQYLLQGHTYGITCVCVSTDKRWIVTADAGGDENMIVVWDADKAIPVRTLFDPHTYGTQSVDISLNSMFICSLSYPFRTDQQTEKEYTVEEQEFKIWRWTDQSENAIHSHTIIGDRPQLMCRFHPLNYKLIVSNSTRRVIFWSWESGTLEKYSPEHKTNSNFTQSAFIPGTKGRLAATGTRKGDIVLWQQVQNDVKRTDPIIKRALKTVQVHQKAINFVSTVAGKYIVTGGVDGFVRFFDYQLRLMAWFEEFDAGPIMSVSFEHVRKRMSEEEELERLEGGRGINTDEISGVEGHLDEMDPGDEILADTKGEKSQKQFRAPDFIVATSLALILYVKADSFTDYDSENIRGILLMQGQEGPIQSLAGHPTKPYLAISGLSGHLHLWDYEKHQVLSLTMFQKLLITCIAFDPRGEYLAVGCANGVIKILDVQSFQEIQSFHYSKNFIQKLQFSHDSQYFAFTDQSNCVGIFKFGHQDDDERKPIEWVYVGRYRAHKFGPDEENPFQIADLQFGVTPFGDVPRLLSLGEDRRLVEYDLTESTITEGVKLKSIHKIGQSAHPTCFLWTKARNLTIKYPNYKPEHDCLLVCNDRYKFQRFVTPNSGRDTYCTNTFRCPDYSGPITKLRLLPSPSTLSGGSDLLAYCTDEQVVGLLHLPLDGNPDRMMGLIAHAGEIQDFEVSHDGKYLFTCGGVDHTVNKWRIDGSHLRKMTERMSPVVDERGKILENREKDSFARLIRRSYEEVKQYFFYAQIRSQGEVTTNERKISGEVPVSEIPSVLRALEFFATEYEVENFLNELRSMLGYSLETSSDEKEIVEFDQFVKLYVNHKPSEQFTLTKEDVQDAFVVMQCDPISGLLPMNNLLSLISTRGERMSREEVNQCIKALMGQGLSHQKQQGIQQQNITWESNMKTQMDAEDFVKEVLDLVVDDDEEEDI